MIGITIEELYDYLINRHEIEFTYNGTVYSIEPDKEGNRSYFTIWKCDEVNPRCLCRCEISPENNLTSIIDDFLNTRCFNGKSFMDIEKDVDVTVIY